MAELLARLLALQEELFQDFGAAATEQQKHLQQIQQAQQEQIQAQRAQTHLAQAQAALAAAGALQTAQENRAAATAFGVNMEDHTSVVIQTATLAREAVERANAAAVEAEATRSINVLENPLGALAGIFSLPYHEEKVVRNSQAAGAAAARLTALNQAAQTQFRTNEAMARGITDANIIAATEEATLKAQSVLAALKERQARTNFESTAAILALNRAQVDILNDSYQRVVEREKLDSAKQLFDLQMEERIERRKEKEETAAQAQSFLDTVNVGRSLYGLLPLTQNQLVNLERIGGPNKLMLGEFFKAGALKQSTGIISIADDPVSASVLLEKAGTIFSEDDPRSSVQNFITVARKAAKIFPGSKPEDVIVAQNTAVSAAATEQARIIKKGDESNIYAALPFQTLVKQRAVQDEPFFQKILKPQLDVGTGVINLTPHQIFEQAAEALIQGKITQTEAINGITTYAGVATALNNVSKNYRSFGLPSQATYNVELGIKFFGSSFIVNLMSAVEVEAALVRYAATKRVKESLADRPIF